MSDLKNIPWYIWIIPIALLLIATMSLPYGYYTFTRWVVCASAIWFAVASWDRGNIGRAFAVILALVAILFNPIAPVYLRRATWFYFDIGVAVVFAAHLLLLRLRLGKFG